MSNETYNYTIKSYKKGQIIEGTVVQVTDNAVSVDFGYFTEGTIYLNSLTLKPVENANEIVKVGDRIKAKINKIEEEQILLSRIPLEIEENLQELKQLYKKREYITVRVEKNLDKVLIIKFNGIEGIMPKSEVDVDEAFDAATLLGQDVLVKILELTHNTKTNKSRFVVSRKAVQLKDLYEERVTNFQAIELGASYEGEIVRVEDYGALVVANNYQGLVPYREISHLPFEKVSDVLHVGQKVEVKVIDKNEEKLHVLYSIKALTLKPWEVLEQDVNVGDVIAGKVVRMTDFGAFINVAPQVDGLLHVSEYSHNPFVNLFDEVHEGDDIEVKVISLDTNRERLGLSVKALNENNWFTSDVKRFDIVTVKVVGYQEGDAIVEAVEDVWGILPKNQISSDKRINNASDELSIGQEIQVKVTDFDPRNKRLVVSVRRIKEDAERQEFKKYMKEQDEMKKDTLGDILGEQLREVLKRK